MLTKSFGQLSLVFDSCTGGLTPQRSSKACGIGLISRVALNAQNKIILLQRKHSILTSSINSQDSYLYAFLLTQ